MKRLGARLPWAARRAITSIAVKEDIGFADVIRRSIALFPIDGPILTVDFLVALDKQTPEAAKYESFPMADELFDKAHQLREQWEEKSVAPILTSTIHYYACQKRHHAAISYFVEATGKVGRYR